MSSQTFISPDNPFWISSQGTNSISFNKLTAPPLAFLNKGILYEMVDGLLYYNGNPIGGGLSSTDYLNTTGLPVNVAASAPPLVGQALLATLPTSAVWQYPAEASLDLHTFIVDDDDQSIKLGFDISGTPATTVTLISNATANRDLVLPDADVSLLGAAGITPADVGKLPFFGTAGQLFNSQLFLSSDDGVNVCNISNINLATGPDTTTYGIDNLNATLPASGSVIVGSGNCQQLTDLAQSVVIGTDNYFSSLPSSIDTSVIIGNDVGSVGAGDSIFGMVIVGGNNCPQITTAQTSVVVGANAAQALTSGTANVLIGYKVGNQLADGSGNIYIGDNAGGALGNESLTTRIGSAQAATFISGIRGVATGQINAIPVLVDSDGQLGTVSSSVRFKENIVDLVGSEVLHQLRPVSFNYKASPGHRTVGLVAEEVEKVYPEMCIYDRDDAGRRVLHTVDYARLSILLLAEIQKMKARLDLLAPMVLAV